MSRHGTSQGCFLVTGVRLTSQREAGHPCAESDELLLGLLIFHKCQISRCCWTPGGRCSSADTGASTQICSTCFHQPGGGTLGLVAFSRTSTQGDASTRNHAKQRKWKSGLTASTADSEWWEERRIIYVRRKTGSICRIHFGDIILSWPASYLTAGFKLQQWAGSPSAMNWEEIPNELIFINPSSPETATYFPPQPGSGRKFYRLHRP